MLECSFHAVLVEGGHVKHGEYLKINEIELKDVCKT